MTLIENPRLRLYVGAALISLSPIWVRLASVAPTTSGFYRVAFGGAALALILIVSGRRINFSKRIWAILLLGSVFFALDIWFWHRSIFYVGPGLATLLGNFQVFLLMLASIVLLKRMPRPAQLIAVPLALFGLGLIVGFDWQSLTREYQLGVIFGLLTAVAYAAYVLTLRAVQSGTEHRLPVGEVAVISLVTTVIMGAANITEGLTFAIPTWTDAGWLLAYGVVSHCVGWLFIASGVPHVAPTDVGLALLLQPTLSFIWDIVFFARPITAVEISGAAIVLFAIYLGSRSASREP